MLADFIFSVEGMKNQNIYVKWAVIMEPKKSVRMMSKARMIPLNVK